MYYAVNKQAYSAYQGKLFDFALGSTCSESREQVVTLDLQ